MKIKVLKRFIDEHTSQMHEVNDVLEVTKERYEEITSNPRYDNHIEVVKEKAQKASKAESKEVTEKVTEKATDEDNE